MGGKYLVALDFEARGNENSALNHQLQLTSLFIKEFILNVEHVWT